MFEDITRWVILTVVWVVIIVRAPAMVRDKQQRPLFVVLAVIALGAIPIQPWFAGWIDGLVGDAKFHNLFRGLFAILDAAVTWRFVVHIAGRKDSWWHSAPGRRLRAAAAWGVAAAIIICYYVTPAAERFRPSPSGSFAVYNVLIFSYLAISLGAAAVEMWRHLPGVRGHTLRVGLALVAIGNLMEVPFAIIRVGERLTWFSSPALTDVAFYASTARFIMVPLGCVVAAFEPMRAAAMSYYRRVRLYPLWRMLRESTPEITLAPPVSRWQDLVATDNSWERLHRRIIEIRDSAFHLYDTWAWPELLERAQADESAGGDRIAVTARWLEVARRESLAGAPKRYRTLDKALLPELTADLPGVHDELRYLLKLHRNLNSAHVRAFADNVLQGSSSSAND